MYPELKKRLITAGALITTALALIFLGYFFEPLKWICALIVLLVVSGALLEYSLICLRDGESPIATTNNALITMVPPVLVLIAGLSGRWSVTAVAAASAFATALVVGLFVVVRLRESLDKPLSTVLEPFVMYQLFGVGGASLVAVAFEPLLLLWLLFAVYCNDAGAYFIGCKYQGPKLAPGVSPAKTISGAIGGLGAGLIAGIAMSPLIFTFSLLELLILTTGVIISAQVGDLLKSILKRLHQVKDSSSLLPGHGGLLDRIDSVLLGSIVVVAWKLL